jgi:hypothetical protein
MSSGVPGEIPGYWMNETGGVVRPAVRAYLHGEPMTPAQVAAMRAYLIQWIAAPGWAGPIIDTLRAEAGRIATRADIDRWLDRAGDQNIDPL